MKKAKRRFWKVLVLTETTLGRGGDCGLKAYEVVRFAIVSSVRGRQCPVGEERRSSGGWVGDAHETEKKTK